MLSVLAISGMRPDPYDITSALDLLKASIVYGDGVMLLSYEAHHAGFMVGNHWRVSHNAFRWGAADAASEYDADVNLRDVARVREFIECPDSLHQVSGLEDLSAAVTSGYLTIRDPLWDAPSGPSRQFVERILEDLDEFREALPIIDAKGLADIRNHFKWLHGLGSRRGDLLESSLAPLDGGVEAALSQGLLARLPSFAFASVSELLDVREELSSPLIRYRGAVSELSRQLPSVTGDPDGFVRAVDQLWRESVAPELVEIEELMHEASFIRQFGLASVRDMRDVFLAGGATWIGLGAIGDTSHATPGAAAAAAVAATTNAAVERRSSRRQAQQSRFFMLHKIEDGLRITR